MLISLGKVKVKTYEKKKLQNEFKINFRKKLVYTAQHMMPEI